MPNHPRDESDFPSFFRRATGLSPHPWQARLGDEARLQDRLIRVPTGFGKTAGVVTAWLHHRVGRNDRTWPTRLVLVFPMRTLVEQTLVAIGDWLKRTELEDAVKVHRLMGGVEAGAFHLDPTTPSILVGTQDMIVSRALNRGFGAARARWPIDFGLLTNDCLWVCDEVQLMDTALTTSVQLNALRAAMPGHRPFATWWMSATMQPSWFRSVDSASVHQELVDSTLNVSEEDWGWSGASNSKLLEIDLSLSEPETIAARALESNKPRQLTLVVVNTVDKATSVFQAMAEILSPSRKRKSKEPPLFSGSAPDIRLIHSRFRPADRANWADAFLSRRAAIPEEGRVIIATQVVEAGVDISASTLITELAPWPSLVQRFGRAARFAGESAKVLVVGPLPTDRKKALPYSLSELEAVAAVLNRVGESASPRDLERFERELAVDAPDLHAALFPYDPAHVLRRSDVFELFDTSADLSGADIDVSRWIRSSDDDRDVAIFWRDAPSGEALDTTTLRPPGRDELCAIPIGQARDFIDRVRARDHHAWHRDFVSGDWIRIGRDTRFYTGMTILLPTAAGGYGAHGFDAREVGHVVPVGSDASPGRSTVANALLEAASSALEGDELSALPGTSWQAIDHHGLQVAREVTRLATAAGLPEDTIRLLELAGRWHDLGKAHEAFQQRIREDVRHRADSPVATRRDVAKAPDSAWSRRSTRRGFRHELMSMLSLFDFVWRIEPRHPWLLGGLQSVLDLLDAGEILPAPDERVATAHPLAAELVECSSDDLDLIAYLVLSHHGKPRMKLSASVFDSETVESEGLAVDQILGVRDGDEIAATRLASRTGESVELPPLVAHLALARIGLGARFGAAWNERTQRLLARRGPFHLAYLETLLRAADVRASMGLMAATDDGGSE